MKVSTVVLCVLLMPGLGGCDREVEETVFDDQVETLDRARAVEDQLNERAEALGERLDNIEEDEEPE